MFKYFLIPFVLLAFSACRKGPALGPGNEDLLASAAETDCGFVQNPYGERVSWKKNIPVTLELHKDFPPDYEEALNRAAQHWNEAAGMTLFIFVRASETLSSKPLKDTVSAMYWLREWPESQKNQQALTNLYWNDNQLYEADIGIDNQYFNFFVDQTTTPYDIHLESLFIHELGHVLGLKHRSTVPSVMWSVLNGGLIRDTLTAADRDSIKCEY